MDKHHKVRRWLEAAGPTIEVTNGMGRHPEPSGNAEDSVHPERGRSLCCLHVLRPGDGLCGSCRPYRQLGSSEPVSTKTVFNPLLRRVQDVNLDSDARETFQDGLGRSWCDSPGHITQKEEAWAQVQQPSHERSSRKRYASSPLARTSPPRHVSPSGQDKTTSTLLSSWRSKCA